jgi:hypothetical protein
MRSPILTALGRASALYVACCAAFVVARLLVVAL